jgi:hypothetical protein
MRLSSRWLQAVFFLGLLLLILIANRGAYQGYFDGDDLDNISWTSRVAPDVFARGIVSPVLAVDNFRPVGHFYFFALSHLAGLNYGAYVGVLQLAHLLNVLLLFLLLRRLGFAFGAAAAGTLFFGFEMAVFDAFWKPMYIFDVLCATFCLLSMLCYHLRRYTLSFVCLLLAYKAKEPAVMLPVLLTALEYMYGAKNWDRLIPFFAFSALFGGQAVFAKPQPHSEYSLSFSAAALWTTVSFYSYKLFFAPFAGLATLALPFLFRDRRVWLGVAGFWILLFPMLVLPGRLFAVYMYLPLTALSIAVAAIATHLRPKWIWLFFALWIPVNYQQMRVQRKAALAYSDENRKFVEKLEAHLREHPATTAVVHDDVPNTLHAWGVSAAARLLTKQPDLPVYSFEQEPARAALDDPGVLVLSWDRNSRRVETLRRDGVRLASAIRMETAAPIWQLHKGWYTRDGFMRWIEPQANAALYRPAAARRFVLKVNAGPLLLERVGVSQVELLVDGQSQGTREFRTVGLDAAAWDLPAAAPGDAQIEFRVRPEYRDSPGAPPLGIAIVEFGFMPDALPGAVPK